LILTHKYCLGILGGEKNNFFNPVRLSGSHTETNKAVKASMLSAGVDIAASSIIQYPYGLCDRFNSAEKRRF
jgi:hypothetical protein